jgi:AcrR family transcriptional regulator
MSAVPPYHTIRAGQTRASIIATAERLYAERGIAAVSNRQVSEAAGQGNTAAVAYHFGTRNDLIRAIVGSHTAAMDEDRRRMLTACEGSLQLRDWVACAVRPITGHLAGLGTPSWYARFAAQLMTDPALRTVVTDDVRDSPALRAAVAGVDRCLPDLPPRLRARRNDLARTLITHACAEHERELALGGGAGWDEMADMLIDAVAGLLAGPVTS